MGNIQTMFLRPNTPKDLYTSPVNFVMPSAGNVNINVQNERSYNVSSNGVYNIEPGANYDAMYKCKLNVQVPSDAKTELELDETVTQNGVATFTPGEGNVYNAVSINVQVPSTPAEPVSFASSLVNAFVLNAQTINEVFYLLDNEGALIDNLQNITQVSAVVCLSNSIQAIYALDTFNNSMLLNSEVCSPVNNIQINESSNILTVDDEVNVTTDNVYNYTSMSLSVFDAVISVRF